MVAAVLGPSKARYSWRLPACNSLGLGPPWSRGALAVARVEPTLLRMQAAKARIGATAVTPNNAG